MKNLKLRTKLLAIAVPPLAILAVLVSYTLKLTFLDGAVVDGAAVQQDLRVLGIVGLAGVLGSALVLVMVTRSVTVPLDRLTKAADELSSTRLPALVELLRNPGASAPAPAERLGLDSDDELGRLARAVDDIHAVAAEVTVAQQGLVRASISTLVVNLARRNQALVERQLEFIDQLETNEADPDRLDELYRLDHLATRMRRNAESLLVLAGAEPTRRRGAPVRLLDVLRVAMSEIEDYRHIELGGIQDVRVGSGAAVDLAHLLSELMENATSFSPPDTPVLVDGGRTGDGRYSIAVVDRGIGMGDEQRAEANTVLARPPELSLELSRSLGFLVIGRLAKRLGVTIELQATPGGGTTATVTLPASLLIDDASLSIPASPPVDAAVEADHPAPSAGDDTTHETAPAGVDVAATDAGPEAAVDAPARAVPTSEAVPAIDASRVDAAPPAPGAAPRIDATLTDATRNDATRNDATRNDATRNDAAWNDATRNDASSNAVPPAAVDAEGAPPATDAGWPPAAAAAAAAVETVPEGPAPRQLSEALPAGEAFDRGMADLLAGRPTVPPPGGADVTSSGLVRRRRGEQAPATGDGRPVTASGRTPEEIREMLARYRSGIKARRPATGPGSAENTDTTPHQEGSR